MQIFPNITSRFIDNAGRIVKPWIQYLQQFTQAPPAISSIGVTASPFTFEAKEPGFVAITGGTVSKTILIRGKVTIDVGTLKLVPVAINDDIVITFSVLPVVQFIPSYGANTLS